MPDPFSIAALIWSHFGPLASAAGSVFLALPTLINGHNRDNALILTAQSEAVAPPGRLAQLSADARRALLTKVVRRMPIERWAFKIGLSLFALGQVALLADALSTSASAN